MQKNILPNLSSKMQSRLVSAAICAAAASLFLFFLLMSPALYNADLAFQDFLFQHPMQGKEDGKVVVIGFDEYTEERVGSLEDARLLADLIEELNSNRICRPAAIGIDVLLTQTAYPDADQVLEPVFRQAENVVLACSTQYQGKLTVYSTHQTRTAFVNISEPEIIWPALQLTQIAQVGHTVTLFDADGVARRHLWSISDKSGQEILSMPYLLYRLYCEFHGFEATFAPDLSQRNSWGIPFSREPGGFYAYSAADILQGTYDPEMLCGAIIYIGAYHTASADEFLTPLDYTHPVNPVEYLANVSAAMLAGRSWQEGSEAKHWLVLIPVCFVLTFAMCAFQTLRRGLATVTCALVCCLLVAVALYQKGIAIHALWAFVAVLLPLAFGAMYRSWRYLAERKQIADTLQRYVDMQIIRELTHPGTRMINQGHVLEVAVLFADIRGFTSMSEKLPADAIIAILNEYLSLMSQCVRDQGGTVDKFIGDAIMALWGAPVARNDSAVAACRAGLSMVRSARQLAEQTKRRYGYDVEFGIGIHFGPAVIGNIGSPERMDYTAVGDVVNTAARLEALAPGSCVYISRQVADQLGNCAKTRSIGTDVRLKGKSGGIEVLVLESLQG